jgi:hypothetical protein
MSQGEGSRISIAFRVLGEVGRDGALLVTTDAGQVVSRLLFDCGIGCM